ncbi:MAG: hypothetical protein NVS4B8_16970 [Herpetosiphon sp.]
MDSAEKLASRLGGESFETALGILNAPQCDGTHDEIEDTAHYVAVARFADALSTNALTGADYDVGAGFEADVQLNPFIDGDGKVGVTEEYVLAPSGEHTSANSKTFATMVIADQLPVVEFGE